MKNIYCIFCGRNTDASPKVSDLNTITIFCEKHGDLEIDFHNEKRKDEIREWLNSVGTDIDISPGLEHITDIQSQDYYCVQCGDECEAVDVAYQSGGWGVYILNCEKDGKFNLRIDSGAVLKGYCR